MTTADFLALRWSAPGSALIGPPALSPVIADPTFLFPEETPDSLWQLFAHSAWGIHRFSSADGRFWRDHGVVVWHAMRPFVRRVADETGYRYVLLYEKYPPFALVRTALPGKPAWRSELCVSVANDPAGLGRDGSGAHTAIPDKADAPDLFAESGSRVLIRPDASDWMKDNLLGQAVSNPCLIEAPYADGPHRWRLYFSASLAFVEDCGFNEPRYIGMATGPSPGGPFTVRPEPVIDPAADTMTGVLGAGSIKVLRMDDGWIGLQNKIYHDRGGHSRSAIFVLRSTDGIRWYDASGTSSPLVAPPEQPDAETAWMSSHVYACDCRYRQSDGGWYLFYNARDGWTIAEGKERIGRLIALTAS